MNNFKLTFFLILFAIHSIFSQLLTKKDEKEITNFISTIKDKDINKLDTIITYPFKRPYPIPAIRNKKDLELRFTEIFDDSLIAIITKSKLEKDWHIVGLQGIMLKNGLIWLDREGKLINSNYSSKKEKALKNKYIDEQKINLHSSLKEFKTPILSFETENYRIRIDKLDNNEYRYASWIKSASKNSKPNLILFNGEEFYDGKLGDKHFIFSDLGYTFTIYVNKTKSNKTPSFNLVLSKGNTIVFNEASYSKRENK